MNIIYDRLQNVNIMNTDNDSTKEAQQNRVMRSLFDKIQFYQIHISHCENKHALKTAVYNWSVGGKYASVNNDVKIAQKWYYLPAKEKMQQLKDVFQTKHLNFKQYQLQVTKYAVETLQRAIKINKQKYLEYVNEKRFEQYVKKAAEKSNMKQVKQIKASWYHGTNQHHGILIGDVLNCNHLIALICYSNNSNLCTEFRGTYRRLHEQEDLQQQK
eukprot:316252_1